jgi:signal peptidase I
VVACGGDTIEIKNNQLIINDVPLRQTLVKTAVHQPLDLRENDENMVSYSGAVYLEYNRDAVYPIFLIDDPNYIDNMPKRTIPSEGVFVLGDNRNLSIDSRRFGYVPESQIEGIARYLIWTSGDWSRWGLIDAKSKNRFSHMTENSELAE